MNSYTNNTQNSRESFKAASFENIDLIMFSLFYALLGISLPALLFLRAEIAVIQALSVAICVVWLFLLARLSHSRRQTLSFAITLGFLLFISNAFVLSGVISAFTASTLIPAFLLAKAKNVPQTLLVFLSCALVCAASSLLFGGAYPAAVAFLPFIPAVLLASAIKSKLPRVRAACRVSIGFVVSLLGLGAVWVIKNSSEGFIAIVRSSIENARSFLVNIYSEAIVTVFETTGNPINVLDALETATVTVGTVFNVLPAIILVIISIVSFALHSLLLNVFAAYEEDRASLREMSCFDMSLASSVIFLSLMLVVGIFSESQQNVYSVTALNVAIVLVPGLAFCAFLTLRQYLFSKSPSCSGVMFYALVILLFVNYTSYATLISSVAGAIIIIVNHVKRYIDKKANTPK